MPERSDAPDTHARAREPAALLLDQLVALVVAELVPHLDRSLRVGTGEVDAWRLLTVEDAAARLGRSTRWVRDRAKRGELPFVRLDGGALAFELEDLQAFARVRKVGSEGPVALAGRLQAAREPASANGLQRPYRVDDRRVGP